MIANITHKSQVTANGDYEVIFNVVENEQVIYPGVKVYCNAGDDIVQRVAKRVSDIKQYAESVASIPEVIDLPVEVEEQI